MSTTTLLGEVVTWDLQTAIVGYDAMKDALRDSGLDPDAAKDMKPRAAFGRACKDLKKERAIDKLRHDKKAGEYKFQFTRKSTTTDGLVDYDYECIITLDADTGAVSCSENPDLADKARELIQHALKTRTAQDITRLVQKLFQDHADLYPINPRKGVAYFVPECHREFTAKVDDFLKRVGGGLARFPVPKGTAEGNASVKEAVQSGLQTLLGELNQAVADWDDTTRTSTMDKATAKWQAISHKVECYEEYLGAEQDRLRAELVKAKDALRAKILELKPEDKEEVAEQPEPVAA